MNVSYIALFGVFLVLTACRPSLGPSVYNKQVEIPPGKAHYKELYVDARNPRCEVSLKTAGGERVDFGIFRRMDYQAYKAGTSAAPIPVMARTNIIELDAVPVVLLPGDYLLSVHNFTQGPVLVTMKYSQFRQ